MKAIVQRIIFSAITLSDLKWPGNEFSLPKYPSELKFGMQHTWTPLTRPKLPFTHIWRATHGALSISRDSHLHEARIGQMQKAFDKCGYSGIVMGSKIGKILRPLLTDAVAPNISGGTIDASQLFPAFPPPVIDCLGSECQQEEQSIAYTLASNLNHLAALPLT